MIAEASSWVLEYDDRSGDALQIFFPDPFFFVDLRDSFETSSLHPEHSMAAMARLPDCDFMISPFSALRRQRLMEERKMFRKNRAFGFVASPVTLPDGTQVILRHSRLVSCRQSSPAEFDEMGMLYSRKRWHVMGRWFVPSHHNFPRDLSCQRADLPVSAVSCLAWVLQRVQNNSML